MIRHGGADAPRDRLIQHRRGDEIPHAPSSRRRRGFNAARLSAVQRSGCRIAVQENASNKKARARIPIQIGVEPVPAVSNFFAGPTIVATVQARKPAPPYLVTNRCGQINCRCAAGVQRGLDLKAYPIGATAFRSRRRSRWGCLRRAARALSRALHYSREQAARKIIHDCCHLIQR